MAPKANTTTAKTLSNLPLTTVIRLAFTYFGIVFSTGFFFGTIRQLYVIPKYHLPSFNAEIIEAPLMLIAVIIWANWLVNHYKIPAKATVRLAVGLLGLGVMACVEFMGSRFVGERGPAEESEEEEWAGVARVLYLFDLIVFGIMPWILMLMEKE
ncbi:hypothetical protein BKA56DRAFT_605292 [Ilyonectria sp. MPI-CAGE-AT-0026]|nr:hypothetical protein BKA56DRAFT_605292 [Ilyonectria sp. MPI-CAGE-AT-0026]